MFNKHRFEIWTPAQHPLKHTLTDFAYTNPSLPGVTDVNSAINWIVKVLYPNAKDAVATPGDLPAVGNTLNDYRVVLDDGDGNQAGYRWEQREGDVAAQWYKVYDFDWSTDSIIAAFMDVTQDLYVYQKGKSDLDADGDPITGVYSGQTISGGNVANQNLTLRANSGDGTGAHTGFVQVDDNFRPTVTGTYDLGTVSNRFGAVHLAVGAYVNTLTIESGQISDSGGSIDFDDNDLSTTGNINGAVITAGTSFVTGTMLIEPGYISDSGGSIDFDGNDLLNVNSVTGLTTLAVGTLTLASGSITDSGGTISFGSTALTTTGSVTSGQVNVDNLRLDGNTLSITNTNGNLILQANGTGIVDVQNPMTTLGQTVTGVLGVTGQLNIDNLRLDGNVLSSTNANGNIALTPNGTGLVTTSASFLPSADAALDLGATASRFKDIYLSGSISDGTTAVSQATLQSLRDINVGATAGMALFFDGAQWLPSLPDTEINHADLNGLTTGDAGHTQFVMLAGRAGGQTIQGDTAANGNLLLESTANVTKGKILFKDVLAPNTNASFSGGWQGTDIGGSSNNIRDIYTKGEMRGMRLENFTFAGLPSSSGQNVGRVAFTTDQLRAYVDTGVSWEKLGGSNKFLSDTVWDGIITQLDVTVSADIDDARNAVWALHDNGNDFDRIYCSIKAISATQVRITVSPALPSGNYRLIGFE